MSDQAQEQSPQELMENLLAQEDGLLTEDPEQQEQEQETEETEDSQEQTEEPEVFVLTHNGQEVSKPKEEVIALAQQGFDYTQKTQKLAEERQHIEAQTQAVKAQEEALKVQIQMHSALMEEVAAVKSIDQQLAQYQGVNWAHINQSDPVQAQALWFQYGQLKDARQTAVERVQAKQQEVQRAIQESFNKKKEAGRAELNKLIPNFNDATAVSLQQFAAEMKSDVGNSFNPNDYKVLWMAQQYAKLQAEKSVVQNKVVNKPPVVKPGGKDQNVQARSDRKEAINALRKTTDRERSKDLASKLIEGML